MDNKEPRRLELYNLLGDLPERDRKVFAETLSVEERQGYILERLVLDLNGLEPVPAILAKPLKSRGRLPAVLFCHSHGGCYKLGKNELLEGNTYLHNTDYATELTSRGYAVLCIDTWAFGERSGRTESEIFKEMLLMGRVMWGMMVYDSLKAVDYLQTREDIDSDRLAIMGMSMGSTMAWWTAALDTRLKVCIDLCCLTDFDTMVEKRRLDAHGVYYFVPGLMKHFTGAGINSLISPRPHLALAGTLDYLTPPEGLEKVNKELVKTYTEEKAPEAWKLITYETGHNETPAMRKDVMEFLETWL